MARFLYQIFNKNFRVIRGKKRKGTPTGMPFSKR